MEDESSSCFFINGDLLINQYLEGTWMNLLMLSFLASDLEFKNLLLTSIGLASMYSQKDSILALGKALYFSKSPSIGWPWMAWRVDFSFSKFGPCTLGAVRTTTLKPSFFRWGYKHGSQNEDFHCFLPKSLGEIIYGVAT